MNLPFPITFKETSSRKTPMSFARKSGCLVPGGQEAETVRQGEPAIRLTDCFETNKHSEFPDHIIYFNLPKYYTWNQRMKQWQKCHCENLEHHQLMLKFTGIHPNNFTQSTPVRIIPPMNASSSQNWGNY